MLAYVQLAAEKPFINMREIGVWPVIASERKGNNYE